MKDKIDEKMLVCLERVAVSSLKARFERNGYDYAKVILDRTETIMSLQIIHDVARMALEISNRKEANRESLESAFSDSVEFVKRARESLSRGNIVTGYGKYMMEKGYQPNIQGMDVMESCLKIAIDQERSNRNGSLPIEWQEAANLLEGANVPGFFSSSHSPETIFRSAVFHQRFGNGAVDLNSSLSRSVDVVKNKKCAHWFAHAAIEVISERGHNRYATELATIALKNAISGRISSILLYDSRGDFKPTPGVMLEYAHGQAINDELELLGLITEYLNILTIKSKLFQTVED